MTMVAIKSYTDIEQSKKLAEILPLESADMHYATWAILDGEFIISPNQGSTIEDLQEDYGNQIIPSWSLASLLSILPDTINGTEGYCRLTIDKEGDAYNISYDDILSGESTILFAEYSLIDACVEMIVKLHKQNML